MTLQKEKEQQSEQHKQTMQKLQAKYETDMSHLHQEHALSAAKVRTTTRLLILLLIVAKYKIAPNLAAFFFTSFLFDSLFQASEVIGEFEKSVAQLKQQLMESEHRRHQEVRV